MRSLSYPASRPIARGKDFLLFLLSTAANRWDVVASLDLLVCRGPIIARVQTEILGPLDGAARNGQGRCHPGSRTAVRTSWRLAPSMTMAKGMLAPSVKRLRLVPFFPRSVGLASASGFSQRSFCHCSIYSLPLPLDSFQFIILL
jgi:hypothetical protein